MIGKIQCHHCLCPFLCSLGSKGISSLKGGKDGLDEKLLL
jgi:hypothetical protein